ncbi:unnamed protein product, partial [Porites evermanni]
YHIFGAAAVNDLSPRVHFELSGRVIQNNAHITPQEFGSWMTRMTLLIRLTGMTGISRMNGMTSMTSITGIGR